VGSLSLRPGDSLSILRMALSASSYLYSRAFLNGQLPARRIQTVRTPIEVSGSDVVDLQPRVVFTARRHLSLVAWAWHPGLAHLRHRHAN